MNRLFIPFLLAVAVSPAATIVYQNTTGDLSNSVYYSASLVTEIGDQVRLTAPTMLDSVTTQFYNVGVDTTFDASILFYNIGSPVGTLIGSMYTVTGISIPGGSSQNVTFSNLGILVPQDVIVTFSVANVGAGGDLGLNLFDPPGTGSSLNSFFITFDGQDYAQASTNFDIDNIYLEMAGTPMNEVPEPVTAGTAGAALVLLAWLRHQRKRA